ncbi:MAG: T9SS type A sorting domain-containing protein [Ignavibacteria bacterium]|nr:T9SS type A sorting domain-containing protein [Ignavibacteria bacterium]
MKPMHLLLTTILTLFLTFYLHSEPGFNGSAPGCSGSGCHSFQDNMISVVPMSNFQVQVTLTGTTSNVGGELVDENGTVVAVINSTSSNPFILTAPSEGPYLVNAGFKNPSPRRWDSTHVVFQPSLPPDPPTNLVAQFIPSPLSVELTWTDNSNNEFGFIIERESQGPDAFVVIDTVSANTNLFVDNTVSYATYNYRITAYNAFGQSAYSNVAQIIVPVELTSFNASIKDEGVLLEWTTATELNNSGFEIQRNQSSNWETIGFVEGRGTTTEITNYQFFNDLSVLNLSVKLQYRLKQVDFGGTFSYSNIIEIDFIPETYSLSQNYPNPFNPSTSISFTLTKITFVTLKIYNVLGNEITTLVNQNMPGGKHEIKFNANRLPSGVYLYTITAGDFVDTKKMLLMK